MKWLNWLKKLFWEKEETSLFYMQGHDVLPQPLSREEEEEALIAWENGDEAARSRLIEHNLRLVVYIAKKFDNTSVGVEDLISIGTIGLIKAVNTFRRDKNIKLVTYASRCIENEILMFLRKKSRRKVEVSFDGDSGVELKVGDKIVVHKAEESVGIIRLSKISFLEILRKKMQNYT